MKFFVLKAYGEPPQLEIKESSIPDLSEDDILVKVGYSAVNDYDWFLSTGKPCIVSNAVWSFEAQIETGNENERCCKANWDKNPKFSCW